MPQSGPAHYAKTSAWARLTLALTWLRDEALQATSARNTAGDSSESGRGLLLAVTSADQLSRLHPVDPSVDRDLGMLAIAYVTVKGASALFPSHGLAGFTRRRDRGLTLDSGLPAPLARFEQVSDGHE